MGMSSSTDLMVSEAKLGNLNEVRNLLRSAAAFDPNDVVHGDTALTLASAYGYRTLFVSY